MNQQRWIRGDDEARAAFDWRRVAHDLEVPADVARALYARATRQSDDLRRVEALYRRWLRAAVEARRAAPPPPPGRQTRVMHEARSGRSRQRRDHAPGKWTRSLIETPAASDEARRALPGYDDVQRAVDALVAAAPSLAQIAGDSTAANDQIQIHAPSAPAAATVGTLREQLARIAGETGRGVADALTSVDPAVAAEALRELRRHSGPILRLVTQAAGGEVERVLARESTGAALPESIAARMSPHVGEAATGAARLHTDDTADAIADAHHARALTVGSDIYFARGEFAPGTERGDDLIAHELTHVAQGQRGELSRAAAKGIASGSNLDASEAEAELRAKVAVIKLHAPEGAVPALASPSGQPTTPGDRQAKIAAQNQRLNTASRVGEPLAVPPAPPATSPQAAILHPAPPLKAPPPAASSGNAYVDTFAAPPSKQATELWEKAGSQATTKESADQAKFDAGLPQMPVLLDGKDMPGGKSGATGGRQPAQPPAAGAQPPAATPTPTPKPPPVTTATTAANQLSPTADKATIKADGQKLIDNLPTTSPDVKTDPGPAPVTDLAGQADPVRALGDQQHAVGEGAKALDDAKTKIISGPGAAQIQPVKIDQKLTVPKEQSTGNMPQLPTVEGMQKMKKWNLPTNALGSFDQLAKPKMEASLAQGKAKMTEAQGKRDTDRSKAVTDAEDKVKSAHSDADKQQQTKVADARTKIANHQADTLVKHETEIKKLDSQSSTKKQAAIGKVNDRISADQAKVDADYKDAQKKADDQKKKGEDDAAKKKKEAEDKKKDESWWDKAADAVCDGIKAIADEIDKALDAICQAIGDILNAVKDAACKVIDAARDFVCQALTEFGDWLKSAVTALLGQVFPELAAALNRLIDQAVNAAKAAVNAIADGLKAAVTALCDGLKGALDGIIAAFKAAVQAAATFAQALVTGDWSLVGKMILEGILKLLGIDPGAFYALIGKAADSIDKIIENPGAFVGHLVDAVKLGFKQFGANFWTHLKNGVVQWLFGTFAEAGIHMPKSFDIAGIFDLVCQVLGLTWPRLRGKVVKVIGEKNTKRLEFVGKYIEALVTGGFQGLWQQVQQDMSGLWDMVIGGVKDWIIEKLVQQAIIKIATMWNPAGAIIQLIQTAWNVYCWVKENAQRIFGLVQAVVDSISNIVAGNIGGAANFIEASLAKLVPIAISLFANLLGLGGIADKIKSVIEKVQTKVDQAIDKLIDRVMKMFKGKDGDGDGKDGKDGKGGDHSVGATINFEAAGHAHRMWFEVKGQQATLMVASTPVAVSTHLSQMQGQLSKLPDDKQATARTLLGNATAAEAKATADANKATHADGNAKDSAEGKSADGAEHTVAGLMKQLFEIFEGQNAADLKGACDKAGGVPKTKFSDVMAEHQAGAVAVRPSFLAGANLRLKDAPEKPLDAMRNEVSGSGDKYILKGDPIPVNEIIGQKGISRVLDLPSVFNYYLDNGYKSRLKLTSADDFLKACGEGKFNPATDLNNAAEIRGKVAESWWFAKAQAGGVTLGQIKKDLTVMDTTYDKGMLRLNISAAELAAAHITLHKPTAFDGMMQGWGNDPMWTAAPGSAWGLTRDGMQEGVIKASTLGVFKDRVLILPEPMPKTDEVPKAIAEPSPVTIDHPSDQLAQQVDAASSGQTIHTGASSGDPKAATKKLLADHPNAKLDNGTLTLPPASGGAVQGAQSLPELGSAIAQQTGVSSVSIDKEPDGDAKITGKINPTTPVGTVKAKPLDPTVVQALGDARIKMLFASWQTDVTKSQLSDKPPGGTAEAKVWATFDVNAVGATAHTAAIGALQADALKPGAPRTKTAMDEALTKKGGSIKDNFQTTAGNAIAKAAVTHGVAHSSTPSVQTEIQSGVIQFENNLQLGKIKMPGAGDTPHAKYEPDPTTYKIDPLGMWGWRISFNYKPPYEKMHFEVMVDASHELVHEAKASRVTLKSSDGTVGRGKMGQSPAHQPNSDMHNAHVIADRVRGSGYKQANNLVTTSSTYNLNEMSSAEDDVAEFVFNIDPNAEFDLTVSVQWDKADSDKALEAVIAGNPLWKDGDPKDVKAAFKNYISQHGGFGSKLQRVMGCTYECTAHPTNGKPDKTMNPVKIGPDVYLGV